MSILKQHWPELDSISEREVVGINEGNALQPHADGEEQLNAMKQAMEDDKERIALISGSYETV